MTMSRGSSAMSSIGCLFHSVSSSTSVNIHTLIGNTHLIMAAKPNVTWSYFLVDRSDFKSLHGAAIEYLRDCCTGTHSSASGFRLRSLARTYLRVRRMTTGFGDGAFSAAGHQCWNRLPPAIRLADSVDSFKSV